MIRPADDVDREDDTDDDDVAARALFSDYLLKQGEPFDERFDAFCLAHHEHEALLRAIAQEWGGAPLPARKPPSPHPNEIAGFRILGEIGRGGMGIVYEAEQREPKRRVALKVVRGEFVDPERAKRIELESQVLALLNHPAIVPLFGSGHMRDGSPWFAMERIEGRPLDVALREDQPSLAARLRLFRQICDAVAYAHRKGIVHRDLKPSNLILCDDTSTVVSRDAIGPIKILDFGLARITDADLSLVSLPSDAGRIIGTIAYMSPEQLRGRVDEVDQRSDIYSLGILLHEMLTGQRPYDLTGCWIGDAIDRVERHLHTRPSLLSRPLRGDLDTIILKALAKDPRRRYQSVASLAEDIDRHLAGLPILAHPPSAIYQIRKLIARHRGAAAVAATLLVATIAMGGLLVWHQLDVAANERESRVAIARERDVAAAVVEFQREMLGAANPEHGGLGRDARVVDLLHAAAARIDGSYHDQPEVEGAIRFTIGVTLEGLGLYDEAAPHLEEAVALRRDAYGESHPETLLALVQLGNLRQNQDRLDEADTLYRKALDGYLASGSADAPGALVVRSNLGVVAEKRGDLDQAENDLRDVLAARRRVLDSDDPQLAYSMLHLAKLLSRRGDVDGAGELIEEAVALRTERFGADHPDTLIALNQLGLLRRQQGSLDEARRLLTSVLEQRRERLGADHPDTWTSLNNLAWVLDQLGEREEGITLCREALARKLERFGDAHSSTQSAKANLAVILRRAGELDEAEHLTRDVLDHRVATLGPDHPDTLQTMGNLASLLSTAGQLDEAEEIVRKVLAIDDAQGCREPERRLVTENALAHILFQRHQLADAEEVFRAMRERLSTQLPDDHPHRLTMTNNLASVIRQSSRPAEARVILEEALAVAEEQLPEAAVTGMLRTNLGYCLADLDEFTLAEEELLLGIEILQRASGPDHLSTRRAEDALSKLYERWGFDAQSARWRQLTDDDATADP